MDHAVAGSITLGPSRPPVDPGPKPHHERPSRDQTDGVSLPMSDHPIPDHHMPVPVGRAALPVVVAVADDGSGSALRFAAAEAVASGTRLHVLHVVGLATSDRRGAAERLEHAVRRARAAVAGAVVVSDELFHGEVVAGLVDASTEAGLLVLERHHAEERRTDDGNVCARVASAARSSVVCVPGDWDDDEAVRRARPVTVGVRDALTCGPLLAEAVSIAASRRTRLRVVHVRDPGSGHDPDDEADLDRVVGRALGRCEVMPRPQVVVETVVGRPVAALVEASRTSCLVVVGRHRPRRPGGGSALGPVARAALQAARCPVLVATPTHSVSSVEWYFSGRLE